jgi:hypothetical protein
MAVGLDPWTCYTQQRDARSPVETACLYVNLFPNSNCASARRRLDRAACFRHFGAAAAAPALPTGDGHSGVRRCSSAGSTVSLDGSWSTLQDVTGAGGLSSESEDRQARASPRTGKAHLPAIFFFFQCT